MCVMNDIKSKKPNNKNESKLGVGPWKQRITIETVMDTEYLYIDEIIDSNGRVIFSRDITDESEDSVVEIDGSPYLKIHTELVDILNSQYEQTSRISDSLYANSEMSQDEIKARGDDLINRIMAVIRTIPHFKKCEVVKVPCTNHRYETLVISNIDKHGSLDYWHKKINHVVSELFGQDMYMLNYYLNIYLKRGDETAGNMDIPYTTN